MSGRATSSGALMQALERHFSVPCAIPASRAALGLVAVLKCWRRRHGGICRVALPGAVCHEVLLAVLVAGCEPIFCDVDVANGLVKDSEWRRARVQGADVAIVVHLYGNPASVSHVRSIFPSPDCLVVDDAAQALGAFSQEGPAGALGDIGLLSFGPTKQISTGNAALLFHDHAFAKEVDTVLGEILPTDEAVRATLTTTFRARLDAARARLRVEGDKAAQGFSGLLDGMDAVLFVPFLAATTENDVLREFEAYAEASKARIAKAHLWSQCLANSGLEPVGMGVGCVPWRYACRLPGIDWSVQHCLAEAMRATGMHVGNGYLPVHWFLGRGAGVLPGVEMLAREVFQFWVDDAITDAMIVKSAAAISQTISTFRESRIEMER